MIKNVLKSKLIVAVMVIFGITAFMSCEKDQVKSNITTGVVETHEGIKGSFVDSVQLITHEHNLFKIAVNSSEFKNSQIQNISDVAGIYYYSNGYAAVLISDLNEENVFAYVININDFKPIEVLYATFDYKTLGNEKKNEAIVTIKSSIRDDIFVYNPNSLALKAESGSWGDCMDDAMDELYDDWSDDPAGTFSCWVTGPLCAIGGGIACGLQQLGVEPA